MWAAGPEAATGSARLYQMPTCPQFMPLSVCFPAWGKERGRQRSLCQNPQAGFSRSDLKSLNRQSESDRSTSSRTGFTAIRDIMVAGIFPRGIGQTTITDSNRLLESKDSFLKDI
jgi:hypothetical protein